jgi:hypothetical protein
MGLVAIAPVAVAPPASAEPSRRVARIERAAPDPAPPDRAPPDRAPTVLAVGAPNTQPLARRWPSVPRGHALSLEDLLTDRLTLLGNTLGHHLDLLSHDMFQLRVDARSRRARIRMGGGDPATFSLRLDGDIQVDDTDELRARVHARLALGVRGHELALELPQLDVCPSTLRGATGVEIKLPLFERAF